MGFAAKLGCIVLLAALPVVAVGASAPVEVTEGGMISGVVTNSKTKARLKDAIVVLQCTCLEAARETKTDAGGLYTFRDLPPGSYTLQVLIGQADVSKVFALPDGARFRANFSVDPHNEFRRSVRVKSKPVKQNTSVGRDRKLADEDFDDDAKDAGEMGAGHSVTALYEIVPVGAKSQARKHAKLRYQSERRATAAASAGEWMTVEVRSKPANGDKSRLQEVVMRGKPSAFAGASEDCRFAAAVAQYGMLLRKSTHAGTASFAEVLRAAKAARGSDEGGHRAAFVELVRATLRVEDRHRG